MRIGDVVETDFLLTSSLSVIWSFTSTTLHRHALFFCIVVGTTVRGILSAFVEMRLGRRRHDHLVAPSATKARVPHR